MTLPPAILMTAASSRAEQELDDQLIELFVGKPAGGERLPIEDPRAQAFSLRLRVRSERVAVGARAKLTQQRLDPGVAGEEPRLLLQEQVGSHAAGGEAPHALDVFRPVGVSVEVPRAVVPGLFEQLHEEEERLDRLRPEPQILIEAARLLIVQID